MEIFNTQYFVLTLALVGVVIIIAALLSGLIDRSDLPQVGVFLALGAMLGPAGLALLDVTLESPILRVVATLSLVLVLFTDAVSLSIAEVRRHGALAFRVLGPGTLLSAALIALAGRLLLELPLAAAAILGAALASTDPVMLRGLLRRPGLPEPVRLALRLESGLNDAVLLPVVLVAMSILGESGIPTQTQWARLGLDLFLLGPGAGIAVGLLAIGALEMIRRKTGVRRDYESIYSLGVAFAAYAAAEAVHGSGFLAAFAAGLTITALDVELCDCFLEYGQTTAEMALLFTFVLFGTSLIWSGFTVLSWPVFFFALAVLLIRPIAFFVSLAGTQLDCRSRLLIAWFGPRGLSSLLLILLPVFAAVPGTQSLFFICCFVVLVSVALHGGSLMFLARDGITAGSRQLAPASGAGNVANEAPATSALIDNENKQTELVTVAEMRQIQQSGAPNLVLDVRAERSFADSEFRAQGALRIPPDRAVERLTELDVPRQTWIFAFCA
jgi:NhaP-type Na+/H+ or K+/H+ antiporter